MPHSAPVLESTPASATEREYLSHSLDRTVMKKISVKVTVRISRGPAGLPYFSCLESALKGNFLRRIFLVWLIIGRGYNVPKDKTFRHLGFDCC